MRMHFSLRPRILRALAVALVALPLAAPTAHPQYFGRNKVQFDRFNFRILPIDHFDIYFYPAESLAVTDAARMSERWYHRHSELLNFRFNKNPLIFYADPPDFQQSNVIEGMIEQGTGGVTEGAKDRVIMPFTGSYADNDHVLGHELVHVFQYRIAESMKGGLTNIERIPLWLIEGMAEYLSLGREDANTAMWLRDALRRNDLPTIQQLTTNPRYFPYRYGQALWAYIGGTWGDERVARAFRTSLELGPDAGFQRALGMSTDSLSKEWHAAIRREYGPVLAGRTPPNEVGRAVVSAKTEGGLAVSPVISPDGRYVAYFSGRGLFGIDLYIAEVATGRIVRQVTSTVESSHFDALSFISSAGTWSPDGTRLAAVVYADGDNELVILDAVGGGTERRIRIAQIGGMADPAWSPDGRTIAFSGLKGGISDLYLYDLETRQTTQLTNDKEAQLHPAWSADGRTLAFATDRGEETDFSRLRYGSMRLAMMDVATREVRLIQRLGRGKMINPQFSPDGNSLYFVADPDGVPDVYRLDLQGGAVARLTSVATGISGITLLSPALSVARRTGDVVFSVFDRQDYSIRALTAQQASGSGVTSPAGLATAAILPPASGLPSSTVSRNLTSPEVGLPPPFQVASKPYSSSLSLDYVGGPTVGASFGGTYGGGLVGGIAFGFSDMLGDRILQTVVQAQGEIKDIGGSLLYLNRSRRWNWGVQGYHVPLLGAFATYENVPVNVGGQPVTGTIYTQIVQRVFYENLSLVTQYPFSTTRRLELSAGMDRIAFDLQVDSFVVVGGQVLDQWRTDVPAGTALTFATGGLALVGDNSFGGYVGPIAGGRYRFEASPAFGSLNYTTLLADYRKYFFLRPFTLAFRGFHYGRYGRDAEHPRQQELFVGQPGLIRGYDVGSFDPSECQATAGDQGCPVFTRLNGSRILAANAEFRIPLFGSSRFGLLDVPFLPLEVAPFVDMGAAWNKGNDPSDRIGWRFDRATDERVPVFSAGITARTNLLGFAILEAYWVRPFQRPGKSSFWGFQIIPGW